MDRRQRVQDSFHQQSILSGRDLRGYDWKVVLDPTRGPEEPGLFFGRLFRMIDLQLDRDEKSTWPEGILFEHVLTGRQLTFRNGKLLDLTHAKILGRKPRVRRRKGNPTILSGATTMQDSLKANHPTNQMRRFFLFRNQDLTGVSGIGIVAEGAVFTDGLTVIHWLHEPFSTGIYQTVDDVIAIHGHQGNTQLQFLDEGQISATPQEGICLCASSQ